MMNQLIDPEIALRLETLELATKIRGTTALVAEIVLPITMIGLITGVLKPGDKREEEMV